MDIYSESFLSAISPSEESYSSGIVFLKAVVKSKLHAFIPLLHEIVEINIEDDDSVKGVVLTKDLRFYSFYIKEGGNPVVQEIKNRSPDGVVEGIGSGFEPEESTITSYSFDSTSSDSKELQKAKFLIGKVLSPKLMGVNEIPYLKNETDSLKGIAIAKDKRVYEFQITKNGFFSYKLAELPIKSDSDDRDNCKKGIPCGESCVPRSFECEGLLDPGSNAIVKLAFNTLERSEVPARKEILSAVAKEAIPAIKEFIRDPKGSIERGNKREALRQMLEVASGTSVPTRAEVTAEGMKKVDEAIESAKQEAKKFAIENEQNINNWIVNIGEAGGGAIGGALVPGPIGAIGGAVTGTLATRAAISAVKSVKNTTQRLSDDEAFNTAGRLKKASMLANETMSDLRRRTNEISDSVSEDISGYIIGTSIATATSVIPGVSAVPFRGMIPAMIGSAGVSAAQSSLRSKEGSSQASAAAKSAMKEQAEGVSSMIKGVKKLFTDVVEEGNKRELEMRRKINTRLLESKMKTQMSTGG